MGQPPSPQSPAPAGELDGFLTQVAAGATVYKEGEASEHVYFVQRGRVALFVEGPPKVDLGVAGIGDFFGEASLLDADPRTHTAKALSAATLLKIDRGTMHQLIAQQPEIGTRMLYALIGRERERPVPEPIAVEGISAPAPAPPPPAPAVTPFAPAAAAPAPAERAGTTIAQTGAAPAPVTPPAPAVEPPVPVAPARLEKASLLHASGARFELAAQSPANVGRPDRATGKSPEIDLSPLDTGQTLSRQHAVIGWRDGVFHVKETKATRNGTFVNGHRVAAGVETPLAPGDRLRFGLIELVFMAS